MTCDLRMGDCLAVMAGMEAASIDLTVTSPPYDNLRTYNDSLNDWTAEKWKAILSELFRLTASGGVVVWVVGDAVVKGSETGTSFRQALWAMDCGFRLHDTMIWRKPNPMPLTHNRYEQAFEYMFVLSKGRPKAWNALTEPTKNAGKPRSGTFQHEGDGIRKAKHTGGAVADTKQRENVWTVVNASRTEHPAPFPEALANDHILSWSNPGDIVFDPFLGSGTTGKMALFNGRKFIGIERDPTYFAIAQQRCLVPANDNESPVANLFTAA